MFAFEFRFSGFSWFWHLAFSESKMSESITWFLERIVFLDYEILNIAFRIFEFCFVEKKNCRFENVEYRKSKHGDVSYLFFIVYEVNRLNNNNYFY